MVKIQQSENHINDIIERNLGTLKQQSFPSIFIPTTLIELANYYIFDPLWTLKSAGQLGIFAPGAEKWGRHAPPWFELLKQQQFFNKRDGYNPVSSLRTFYFGKCLLHNVHMRLLSAGLPSRADIFRECLVISSSSTIAQCTGTNICMWSKHGLSHDPVIGRMAGA